MHIGVTNNEHGVVKDNLYAFKMRKSTIVSFVVMVAVATNYIYGVSKIGFIDDILSIVILFWGVSVTVLNPGLIKKNIPLWLAFSMFFLLAIMFLYQSPISFFYEFYKLFLFVVFVPLLTCFSKLTVTRTDEKILNFLSIVFIVNLIVISMQYLISPYIVVFLGMPIEQITMSSKSGRWVGMFESVNSLGDTALLLCFFNEYIQPRRIKIFRFIFILSVVISTSKHAVILLVLVMLFMGEGERMGGRVVSRWIKPSLAIAFAILISSTAYYLNENAFNIKFNQYHYFVKNINNISESDASHIEKRALNIGLGLSIVREHPYGVGLGVWGDSSSRFNNKNYSFADVEMSDSSAIHILVEQGVFAVLYLAVLFSGGILAYKWGSLRGFLVLMSLLLAIDVVTMGLSSGGWPLLFAYIYARLLYGRAKLNDSSRTGRLVFVNK